MVSKQKIIDIYNRFEIPYWTSGKNVTRGWVNVQCPFCDDSSNHCGVSPDSEFFHCWRCSAKGHFVDLLIALTGLSFNECKSIISEPVNVFREDLGGDTEEVEEIPKIPQGIDGKTKLPERFELVTNDTNFPLLDSYLERRRISLGTIIERGCGICRAGPYMNRLVIPVIFQKEVVSFQAADLTGFARLKYRGAPAPYEVNNYLYNYDSIDKRMVVVEGILDAWRVGKEAVAAFTSSLTERQKDLILKKNLDELYFCFDCELEAYYKSIDEAEHFRAYIPVVEVIKLPYGKDPDEIGREEVYKLIAEL